MPNDVSPDDKHCPPLKVAFGFTLGDAVATSELGKLADKILWGNKGPPELPNNVEEAASR